MIPQVLRIDLKDLTDFDFWSRGATFSMRMFGYSMGILIILGSYNRYLLGFFALSSIGVKVRNMKMNFNTGGTWHWVGQ